MQTVQFSSTREMTPRVRGARVSFSCGYCTVTAPSSMVLNVSFRPLTMPTGVCSVRSTDSGRCDLGMGGHLGDAGDEDVGERERDEELPRERLELVLAEPGEGEADPEDHETEQHDLGEHDPGADDLPQPGEMPPVGAHPRQPPAAKEQHRGEPRERERGGELADEEHEEAHAAVLGHV